MEAQLAEMLKLMSFQQQQLQTQMIEQQKQQALLQSQLLEQQKLQHDQHKDELQVLKDLIQGRPAIATNETVPQVAATSPAHTVATFPEFNEKEQWEIYQKRMTHHMLANGIVDENQKKQYFLSWIGTLCYKLIQNLVGRENLEPFSFQELSENLTAHFKKSTHLIIARHLFSQSRKHPDETYKVWASKLHGLSNECKFVCPKDGCRESLVDENIRDMILRHAPHDAIRKTALTDE